MYIKTWVIYPCLIIERGDNKNMKGENSSYIPNLGDILPIGLKKGGKIDGSYY
jgi:hypothetical protein